MIKYLDDFTARRNPRRIFFACLAQATLMKKIKVYETELRSRDERETCFPAPKKSEERGQV
ncbi:MAG: hypothetical protein IJB34_02190 [Clostridia bacterium]|nr:hypothetical protein [Clostridia bacterium]